VTPIEAARAARPWLIWAATAAVLASCSATGHPHAHASAAHRALPSASSAPVDLSTVPLTARDLTSAGAAVTTTRADPVGDSRVRTLLTWCTHTAATEDTAPTIYGPTLTMKGPHGPNTVYSYVRSLPQGTATDATAYAARLVACWKTTLLPVLAAPLDVHIDHLTFATSTAALPLGPTSYGTAQAVEGIVRWHPTPATTEVSTWDAAVVIGAHAEVTILAAGADGLTTGLQHVSADVTAVNARVRAADHAA
jgi:hypothetical protein